MGTSASGNHREGEGILVTSRASPFARFRLFGRACKLRSEFEAGSAIFAIIAIGVVKKTSVSISEVSFR